jgi:hypothetical protein
MVVVALDLTSWSWPQHAIWQCDSHSADVGCVQYIVSTLVACACYDPDGVRE